MRAVFLLAVLPAFAERITVPLRDPGRPAHVRFQTVNGSISVKTHAGREVIIDSDAALPSTKEGRNGMKQILLGHGGVTIEEENNTVTIKPDHAGGGSFTVLVPGGSSVNLKSVNAKEIRVEGLDGEVNAETVNGSVILLDVSGPVVAHALNGKLTANLKRMPEGKPMSFSTLNGRIDVTLPASAKADLKLTSQYGDIFSDFEMQLSSTASRSESNRENGPKYKLKVERSVIGKINGGGAEVSFRTLNGPIYIHRGN
ncbi:MAG: DUF4097 domain-containing protein [Acidobacteria bacterium]|nr:DUF4097 domain-containing protein [Acidobacteriota bacterium]